MERLILWLRQHLPIFDKVLFDGNWWTGEAAVAWVAVLATGILVVWQIKVSKAQVEVAQAQVKVAETQNAIQTGMQAIAEKQTNIQQAMQLHQEENDAWNKFYVQATLFEKLHGEVIEADNAFVDEYLMVWAPLQFGYDDECHHYANEVDKATITKLRSEAE